MKSVEIPIFKHTDGTVSLYELGLEDSVSLEDCDVENMTFYTVDCVGSHIDNGNEYSIIFSSGEDFSSPLTKKAVNELIQKSL